MRHLTLFLHEMDRSCVACFTQREQIVIMESYEGYMKIITAKSNTVAGLLSFQLFSSRLVLQSLKFPFHRVYLISHFCVPGIFFIYIYVCHVSFPVSPAKTHHQTSPPSITGQVNNTVIFKQWQVGKFSSSEKLLSETALECAENVSHK